MAERVLIKIDINANTKSIEKVKARLLELRAVAESLEDRFDKLSVRASSLSGELDDLDDETKTVTKDTDKMGKSLNNMGRNMDRYEKKMHRAGKSVSKFDKFLQGVGKTLQGIIKFGLKALLVNIVGVTVALLAVSGAFTLGRLAIKGWNATFSGAMKAGSIAAASFLAVLSSVIAGQRQFQSATQSARYGGFATGTKNANVQLRGLEQNTQLAVLGAKALSGAFASISTHTQMTSVLNAALTSMGDFAAASADPTKSLAAAGNFLGLLVKNGKLTQDVLDAAADVGPEFQKAIQDGMAKGLTGSDAVLKALMAGGYSSAVAGTLGEVNNTLFGTVKRNFGLIKASFADVGEGFLPGFTQAVEKMSRSIRGGLIAVTGNLNAFVRGGAIGTFTDGFDRMVRGAARLFNEYLPKAGTLFTSLKNWGSSAVDKFNEIRDALRPLLEGAQVLKDAFGPLVKGLFSGFAGGVKGLNELLINNRERFMELGDAAKSLFESFGKVFGEVKKTIVAILPVLTFLIKQVTALVEMVAGAIGSLNKLGSLGSAAAVIGGIAGYIGLGKLGMTGKGVKGGAKALASRVAGGAAAASQDMIVNANNVIVNGKMGASAAGSAASSGTGLETTTTKTGRLAGLFGKNGSLKNSPTVQMLASMLAVGGITQMAQNTSAVGNIAGGAAAGAGIGTMINPGLGTVIGAGIGGAAGLVLEMSPWGEEKRNRDAARTGAKALSGTAADNIQNLLDNGDVLGARNAFYNHQNLVAKLATVQAAIIENQKISDEEIAKMAGMGDGSFSASGIADFRRNMVDQMTGMPLTSLLKESDMKAFNDDSQSFIDSLKTERDLLRESLNPAFEKFDSNMESLGKITGMSAKDVQEMADAIGIDLLGSVNNFGAAIEYVLGIQIPKTIEEMGVSIQNAYISAIDEITNPAINTAKAMEAVDQTQMQVLQEMFAGKVSESTGAQFFRDAASYALINTTDKVTGQQDPLHAINDLLTTIGKGGTAYAEGGAFAGQGKSEFAGQMQAFLNQFVSKQAKELGPQLAGALATNIANASGGQLGLNLQDIKNFDFGKLSLEQLQGLSSAASSFSVDSSLGHEPAQITQMLSSLGLSDIGLAAEGLATAGTTIAPAGAQMESASVSILGSSRIIYDAALRFAGVPGAIAVALGNIPQPVYPTDKDGKSDTPTARFQRTMSAHSRISGMLSGKQTVTSGIRSTNLGSINSDHVTGAAFDVTGQNLGKYSSLVNGSGGFAEFHGTGGARHLHVVPGEAAGDTMSPVMPMTAPSSGGSSVAVSMNIYPSQGMDEEALANKVHARILSATRSANERR